MKDTAYSIRSNNNTMLTNAYIITLCAYKVKLQCCTTCSLLYPFTMYYCPPLCHHRLHYPCIYQPLSYPLQQHHLLESRTKRNIMMNNKCMIENNILSNAVRGRKMFISIQENPYKTQRKKHSAKICCTCILQNTKLYSAFPSCYKYNTPLKILKSL